MRLSSTLQLLLGVACSTVGVAAVPAGFVSNNDYASADAAAYSLFTNGETKLTQQQTNGNSLLGTKDAPTYRLFRGQPEDNDDDTEITFPWGAKTASNTNAYTDSPNTGVTRYYDWTISRATLAPDGIAHPMILVNNAFPGPTIEANWGDMISVTVHNRINSTVEGTSFHWHGFLQTGTPWMDGVPGVSQCPIAPGESYTYVFKAELYGSSWWHAHYSAQYSAGAFGAIVIHGPTQDNIGYDVDLGPVLLTDFYHYDYYSLVQRVMGTDPKTALVFSDNNLINGKGPINCTQVGGSSCSEYGNLSKFFFTSGKTYRLRLVNAGSEGVQKFSIDNHQVTVIAYDFVPIKPYTTEIVTLGIGQRADILVTANQNSNGGAFWMRSTMNTKCSLTYQPNGLAMVYYQNADTNAVPTSQAWVDNTIPCENDDLSTSVPIYPIACPLQPDETVTININNTRNATGNSLWTVNDSSFIADYNSPLLLDESIGQNTSSLPTNWNIYNFGTSKSYRIIINNLGPVAHPMHIHGHNMYVLSSTTSITANPPIVNPFNPTRRDTHLLPPNGQIVIQVDGQNPGVWPLHCHIAWHVSGGLYMNVVENPAAIEAMAFPQSSKDACTAWNAYTSKSAPDQIDSGLKMLERAALADRPLSIRSRITNVRS